MPASLKRRIKTRCKYGDFYSHMDRSRLPMPPRCFIEGGAIDQQAARAGSQAALIAAASERHRGSAQMVNTIRTWRARENRS